MEEKNFKEGAIDLRPRPFTKAGSEALEKAFSEKEQFEDISEEEKARLCALCRGKCCKVSYLPLDLSGDEELKFYQLKGFEMMLFAERVWTIIHKPCKKYKEGFGCMIHEQKPEACKVYDGRKDPLLKEVCLWPALQKK